MGQVVSLDAVRSFRQITQTVKPPAVPRHNAHELIAMAADAHIVDVVRSWVEVAAESLNHAPLPKDLRRDGLRMKAILDRERDLS